MTEPRTPETLYEVDRSGVRLDKFLAEASGCGRRTARALIRAGRVRIDGRHATAAMRLVSGQRIEVINDSTPAPECRDRREAAPRIIDEGAGWLAIAKPAGMHSVTGASGNSVADWLYQRQPETTAVAVSDGDAGLVNRLDRDTSGVLLAARDRATLAGSLLPLPSTSRWRDVSRASGHRDAAKNPTRPARPSTRSKRLATGRWFWRPCTPGSRIRSERTLRWREWPFSGTSNTESFVGHSKAAMATCCTRYGS
jgi:hypothetical protein